MGGVISIVCHLLVHDSPKPFDSVQVRAVRGIWIRWMRQSGLARNVSDIWPFVIGGIVPDDLDQSLLRVAFFNLGEKSATLTPSTVVGSACRGRDCRIYACFCPILCRLCLIFWMDYTGKIDDFIRTKLGHQDTGKLY